MPETFVRIGDFRCFPLVDGSFHYPKGALFPRRSEAELAAVLGPGDVPSTLNIGYSGLLIDTGKQRILIDTGAGPLGASTGRLPENLSACGFSPEQIDLVVLSHLHPDHIGGLITSEGRLRFPRAEVLVSRSETDFWMTESNQAKLKLGKLLGLGEMEELMLSWVQKYISPIATMRRIRLIESDCEAATGILVLPAFGHTPGHLAVLVSSGRQQLLFAGDAILHPAHINRPEWNTVFDVLPEQAVLTRRQILDRSASDRCLMFHYHFPFPCLGSVSRRNAGYRWEPVERDPSLFSLSRCTASVCQDAQSAYGNQTKC
jgi:glyoxylase-like metal-dependent hydrolase (beta-lactamase superfamily II)